MTVEVGVTLTAEGEVILTAERGCDIYSRGEDGSLIVEGEVILTAEVGVSLTAEGEVILTAERGSDTDNSWSRQ